MACEQWRDRLSLYVDGELLPAEASAFSVHMRSCSACAANALEAVQLKRALASAGKRYEPTVGFRNSFAKSLAAKPRRDAAWLWRVIAVPAVLLLIMSAPLAFYLGRGRAQRQQVYSELADLHVAALASTAPVDVVSTDRHTVKPWFQGKIPFTFNLPELQGSEFTLLGGRVTYLKQTPGAQLIYQLRKHEISVFIFQDRGVETESLPSASAHPLSFNMENWTQNGLRYFVVGDVSADDIRTLSKMLLNAG